jgi:energy-coupling factor transporter ATP-binding protein EcfA2
MTDRNSKWFMIAPLDKKPLTQQNLSRYYEELYKTSNSRRCKDALKEANTEDNMENKKEKNFSHWAKRKDRFYPTLVTHEAIPSAVYETREDSDGNIYLREIAFPSDELILIPGTPVAYVLSQIEEFWGREEFFKELGLVYKRGVMFYGPAGCGKTSIIRMLSNEIIKRGGIVLSITDIDNDQDILLKLREVEPNRPVMCIFEDIEKLTENKEKESDVLSFLDGEKQIGNVINIATTNKPDLLEDRLLKRPGRFDLVIGLNPPVPEARRAYIQRLFGNHITQTELTKMVDYTEGLGMAHLRELAVAMLAFKHPFEESVNRLKGNVKEVFRMAKVGDKSVSTGFTIGFKQEK